MTTRFDLRSASPSGYAAMLGLNAHVRANGLDPSLRELIKIRVSQINACAFCIAMHVAEARRLGIGEQRLHLLAAWREAPIYRADERSALAWAEALTTLPGGEFIDEAYALACAQFTPPQIAELALAVVEINAWNRLMIAARTPPMIDPAASPGE